MPRKKSKAGPEGNGPVLQCDEFGPDHPTLADVFQHFEERFDRHVNLMKSHFDQPDELMEKARETNRRLAGLLHGAQQPCLAIETYVNSGTQDSQACGGRCSRSSEAWGSLFCKKGRYRPDLFDQLRKIAEPPLAPEKCIRDGLSTKALRRQSCVSHP